MTDPDGQLDKSLELATKKEHYTHNQILSSVPLKMKNKRSGLGKKSKIKQKSKQQKRPQVFEKKKKKEKERGLHLHETLGNKKMEDATLL